LKQQLSPSFVAQSLSFEHVGRQLVWQVPPQQLCPPLHSASEVHATGHAAVDVQTPEMAQHVGLSGRPAQSVSDAHDAKHWDGRAHTVCFDAGFATQHVKPTSASQSDALWQNTCPSPPPHAMPASPKSPQLTRPGQSSYVTQVAGQLAEHTPRGPAS
jgi:hypothetical protein